MMREDEIDEEKTLNAKTGYGKKVGDTDINLV
jgi:hypothetical protein